MMILIFWTVTALLALILAALWFLIYNVQIGQRVILACFQDLIHAEHEQTAQFKAAREMRELSREGRDLLRARLAQRAKDAKVRPS